MYIIFLPWFGGFIVKLLEYMLMYVLERYMNKNYYYYYYHYHYHYHYHCHCHCHYHYHYHYHYHFYYHHHYHYHHYYYYHYYFINKHRRSKRQSVCCIVSFGNQCGIDGEVYGSKFNPRCMTWNMENNYINAIRWSGFIQQSTFITHTITTQYVGVVIWSKQLSLHQCISKQFHATSSSILQTSVTDIGTYQLMQISI